ncbi:MAG: hypothetical protein R3A47_08620 [Polyangiales bacterium]
MRRIIHGENRQALDLLPQKTFRLLYIDPPFNTGRVQKRERMKATMDDDGSRSGFAGRRYRVERMPSSSYADSYNDYCGF